MPDVRTFAVLSPFVGGDYYGAVIAGVNRAAVAGGDRVLAVQTLDPGSHSADHSGVPNFRRPVAWRYLDGVVVMPGAVDPTYVRALYAADIPVVLVGHELPGVECPVVLADNRAGVRDAVQHLLEHGHERIAFAGNLTSFDPRDRHEGYREGLLNSGLNPDPTLLISAPDNHETGGMAVAEQLIRAGMPATAIVLGTDRNAIGLIQALTAAGFELPGALAVVGFDDIADARFLRPSLSTVNQPLDRLGRVAYDLVAAQGPRRAEPHTVPTVFVARDSCGCPPRGLQLSEDQVRAQFQDNVYLQTTLNIQYELSIELLGGQGRDPLGLAWLGRTPALGGNLGLWCRPDGPTGMLGTLPEPAIEIVGEFGVGGRAQACVGAVTRVGEFPPADLFALADGAAGEIVFVVPVRGESHDWGMLAAVSRIQDTTPPGREMMNHSGALLALALEHNALLRTLHDSEERLRQAALHDHLTGLPNRALFADRLRHAWQRSKLEPAHQFAVLFLDLDGFKQVNDSLGHATGDQLLIYVAHQLSLLLRAGDTAARLGGDEFVILLDGAELPHGPRQVIDRIRATFVEPVTLDGQEVYVGASIGVAMSSDGFATPEDLLRHADAAMYDAKMRRKGTRAA